MLISKSADIGSMVMGAHLKFSPSLYILKAKTKKQAHFLQQPAKVEADENMCRRHPPICYHYTRTYLEPAHSEIILAFSDTQQEIAAALRPSKVLLP